MGVCECEVTDLSSLIKLIYSGKLFGSTLGDIVVIAGTVYQEVIVWTSSGSGETFEVPVLQRLKGHKVCLDLQFNIVVGELSCE